MFRSSPKRLRLCMRAGLARPTHAAVFRTWIVSISLIILLQTVLGCRQAPGISFSQVPPNDLGGIDSVGVVAGHATGFRSGDHVMLFAYNGKWWVQPDVKTPLTPIASDGSWRAQIHLGHMYAAALIRGTVAVKASDDKAPVKGGGVLAIETVPGTPTAIDRMDHAAHTLNFGGQDWDNTFHESEYGGRPHYYLPQNATVDARGSLHLKTLQVEGQRTCSEVNVSRSLGYGTYRLSFTNPKDLEAAAEFSFFNMDVQARTESYREMDFHVSRWGDPSSVNAEYVVQPYYLPANVHAYELPAGPVTITLQWSPGQAAFSSEANGKTLASWKFTAGVPSPSDGHIYLNLCSFGYPRNPLQHDIEIVVNRFVYLP